MKRIFLILMTVMFAVSCSDLEGLNENQKDPVEVSGESLFASAQKRMADLIMTPNVNRNNNRLWVQHWQETTYTDESNYDQVTRSIPDNHWTTMYRDVLKNLDEAKKIIEETDNELTNSLKANKIVIADILMVYAFSNLVETFGDIPYSEALDIEITLPIYDDADQVYRSLIERLNSDIEALDLSNGSYSGTEDLVYGGDVESWRKFANTLKLRMGIMLADVDGDAGLSKETIESAVADGIFISSDDDALYHYAASAPNNNPVNNELVLSGRNDYVPAVTLIEMMNDLRDPRRAVYFDPNYNGKLGTVASTDQGSDGLVIHFESALDSVPIIGNNIYIDDGSDTPPVVGNLVDFDSNTITVDHVEATPGAGAKLMYVVYRGGGIGSSADYSTHSHVNRTMVQSEAPGAILTYVEAKFLLAEAAARQYNVGETAEEHYKQGIEASFAEWNATRVDEYLEKPEVQYDDSNWRKSIGEQAWLALYNRTFAPYLSVRRLDYPILTEPSNAHSGFPVRYTYPVNEQNLNGDNYNAAASNIGGDAPETRLFWDLYYNFDF